LTLCVVWTSSVDIISWSFPAQLAYTPVTHRVSVCCACFNIAVSYLATGCKNNNRHVRYLLKSIVTEWALLHT